jgi:dCMP deaminase
VQPLPERVNPTCSHCGHAAHGPVCFNWSSVHGCDCKVATARLTDIHIVRPDWDTYFMSIAETVSTRGDCRRRQVGCVLVDEDHRIISTGYNGAEPGGPSCLAGQCPRGLKSQAELPSGSADYSDCVAIHAEANALLFARESARGCTVYVTSTVCDGCSKLLRAAGVARVVTP